MKTVTIHTQLHVQGSIVVPIELARRMSEWANMASDFLMDNVTHSNQAPIEARADVASEDARALLILIEAANAAKGTRK